LSGLGWKTVLDGRIVRSRVEDGLGWKDNVNESTFDDFARTSAPITHIQRLPGDSAPLGVINTTVTRGRKEFHYRGGKGPVRKDQSSLKKNPRTKPKEKIDWVEVPSSTIASSGCARTM